MANRTKAYFLSPSFDYSPTAGPILLGSIIADPAHCDRPLNPSSDRVPPPSAAVTSHVKTDWRQTVVHTRGGKLGLWATFLQLVLGAGAGAETTWDAADEGQYRFDSLETLAIEPDDIGTGYLAEALKAPRVVRYLERHRFRKPVFMVVGVKVARGGRGRTLRMQENGVRFEAGVDGSMIGTPVGVGPQVEVRRGRVDETGWGGSDDFVFAYRLRKIKVSKRTGDVDSAEDFTKGALFQCDEDEDDEHQTDVLVGWLEGDDVGLGEPGFNAYHAIDELDEGVDILVVRKAA